MLGKTLGHYQIEAKLTGAERVYRARDLNLGRKVVIKLLPVLVGKSTLNHPNVITIFDVDTAAVDGQPVSFVAMEYFRGRSLDKLIGRKGIRVREAVRYAMQIADGLHAAHAAGIVHGHLQSADILVNEQGEVKILNLGLAGSAESQFAESHSTDERSDIFSLGLILQEMTAGRHAEVPRAVERIVARCADPDPQRRWQRMADVKIALEDAAEDWNSSKQPAESWITRRSFSGFVGGPLVLAALGGGGYIGAQVLKRPRPTFQRLTFQRGNVAGARFAPDGTVLFSAQWGTEPTTLFSMRPGSGESRPLGLPGARVLSVSSLGEMAMLIGSPARGVPGTLARVPLSGGAPREVLENVNDADWSPDGKNLAVSRTVQGRNRIEYPIGTVLDESGGRPPLDLRVSPKGDLLAFFEYDNAIGDFAVTVLDTHRVKRVLSRGWRGENGLAWSPAGDEIWYSGNKTGGEPTVHGVKLNGDDRVVMQAPARISLQDTTREGRLLAAVEDSRVGIRFLALGGAQQLELSWFDASRIYDISVDGRVILFVELTYGQPRNPAIYLRKTDGSPAIRLGDGNRPALSPDGQWVACIVSDGPQTTLNLLPTGPGQTRTIGESGMHYERVEWFPDGKRILFEGNEPGRPSRSFVQDLNGGKPVPLTPEGVAASHISPDQKYATVLAAGRLALFPISGGKSRLVASLVPEESVIRWGRSSQTLFLQRLEGPSAVQVEKLDVTNGRREPWRELRTPDPVGVQIRQVVMTPDGNSYAYSFQRDVSTLYLAEGLK